MQNRDGDMIALGEIIYAVCYLRCQIVLPRKAKSVVVGGAAVAHA